LSKPVYQWFETIKLEIVATLKNDIEGYVLKHHRVKFDSSDVKERNTFILSLLDVTAAITVETRLPVT